MAVNTTPMTPKPTSNPKVTGIELETGTFWEDPDSGPDVFCLGSTRESVAVRTILDNQ